MKEIARYLVAGITNTIVGYGVFWLLLHLGFVPELANAFGYVVALVVAYILNRTFVFVDAVVGFGSIVRFTSSFFVAFVLNQATLAVSYRVLGMPVELAQVFAMIVYTISFYLLNKYFVFRVRRETYCG